MITAAFDQAEVRDPQHHRTWVVLAAASATSQALTAGWPIAAGVIEGACRHPTGDRPGITGAKQGLQSAEAILTLRAVTANGDYWRYHLAREHHRLYPGTAEGQHTLSA